MDKLVTAIGLLAIVPASVVFFVLMPRTLSHMTRILQFSTPNYIFVNITTSVSLVITLLVVTSLILIFSLSSLVIKVEKFSSAFRHHNSPDYFRYLSIFVLFQLFLSVIISYLFPAFASSPIFKEDLGVQNFLIPVSAAFQSLILEFIPISVMLTAYFAVTKNLSLRSFLNPDIYAAKIWVPIAIIATAIASIVYSANIGESVLAYVTFFVLNAIYLKYGFLKAFLANFTISAFNMIAAASLSVPFLTTVITVFLFIWAFFGVYSMLDLAGRAGRARIAERAKAEAAPLHEPQYPQTDPNLLWIRSTCPSCGNPNFHVKPNMTLVCDKCQHEIDRDAIGVFNIRIEYGRPRRF